MRILHLTCNDARTGGALAVHRLHTSLLEAGHESLVLIGGSSVSPTEVGLARNIPWRGLDKAARIAVEATGAHGFFRPSFYQWRRFIHGYAPDVLHVHWTYAGASIPLPALRSLVRRYRTFWTFHDMWPLTGGCGNSKGCERWMTGCGDCPLVAAPDGGDCMMPMPFDATSLLWRLKRMLYDGTRFVAVCPSSWMESLASSSPLMAGKYVVHIPNGVDTGVFRPLDREECRARLGLTGRKVLLFVGKPTSVFAYAGRPPILVGALRALRDKHPELAEQTQLLLVGEEGARLAAMSGYPAVCVGQVVGGDRMAECYSAADVLVYPTQFDNQPGVVQEALACGTPVVASRVDGLPDLVVDGLNGYLADKQAPVEFAGRLQPLLEDEALRLRMGQAARNRTLELYRQGVVTQMMACAYSEERWSGESRDGRRALTGATADHEPVGATRNSTVAAKLRARVDQYGLAGSVAREAKVRLAWPSVTAYLMSRYRHGQARLLVAVPRGVGDDELELSTPVVREGQALADELCGRYQNRYVHAGLRVLIHTPSSGAGRVWMDDLAECMRHVGIDVCQVPWFALGFAEALETFKPNVLVSFDNPVALRSLDLDRLTSYKHDHGLVRLLSAHDPAGVDGGVALSPDDMWRLSLLKRGLTADALFSLMTEAYYERFLGPWQDSGVPFLSFPMAANPLAQRPIPAAKDLDWALPTNNADGGARAFLTLRFMRRIIAEHRGVLVGSGWGENVSPLDHAGVPSLMARARICPNPRIGRSVRYPSEIGPKTFEVPAMAGFVLVTRTAALPLFFREDEIAAARDPREFNRLFDYFLRRPEERYEWVRRGMIRVYSEHTYFHRLDRLVAFVQEMREQES